MQQGLAISSSLRSLYLRYDKFSYPRWKWSLVLHFQNKYLNFDFYFCLLNPQSPTHLSINLMAIFSSFSFSHDSDDYMHIPSRWRHLQLSIHHQFEFRKSEHRFFTRQINRVIDISRLIFQSDLQLNFLFDPMVDGGVQGWKIPWNSVKFQLI